MGNVILPCIWFFLLGSAMGSFFNVLIDRLPEGRDCIVTRSTCSACGTQLRWNDMIPIFSFLFLRGRCRYCGERLSPWYWISELSVGLLYSAAFLRFSVTGSVKTLIGDLLLWSLLFIVAVMDWKTGMIMDIFSVLIAAGGIVTGLICRRGIVDILLGGVVGFLCYGILYFASKQILKREGLGLGDVFLLGAVGFWMSWNQTLITAFLTAYVSLLFIAGLAAAKHRSDKSVGWETAFPLGPSVCIAALVMRIFGERIAGFLSGILFRG